MMIVLFFFLWLVVPPAFATTFYISPTGSNSNNGLTSGAPFLTFAHAINASRAWCGDTLILLDGVYGDGTSTGKIAVNNVNCSLGDELTIMAQNQRQARVNDNGTGIAISITNSSYITVDGLVGNSTNNPSVSGAPTNCSVGRGAHFVDVHHVTARNMLLRNPNKYCNAGNIGFISSQVGIIEDTEIYDYHRHCTGGTASEGIIIRRVYCNPRTGRIAGGYNAGVGTGGADAGITFYPCKGCIAENILVDGTSSNEMYLTEMNADFKESVLMSGSQLLGSICYKCGYGNGVVLQPRNVSDLNHTPQNITIENVALVDHGSPTYATNIMNIQDGVNITIRKITAIRGTGTVNGLMGTNHSAWGVPPAQASISINDSIISGMTGPGYSLGTNYGTYSGNNLWSFNNGSNFSPALPGNWTNTHTTDPELGTCKVYTPNGSAAKTAGAGANILYRYVDGVETTVPLWDPITGEWPHGAIDLDGTNDVTGNSAKDIHERLNINRNGCSFPSGYGQTPGGGGGDPSTVIRGTTAASGLSTTATPLTWNHTISANQDGLLVCIALWHSGANVGSVSAVDSSGQALSLVKRQVTSPDAYRAVEYWWLASPTSGSRTISATLTGNISGALGRSIEFDATSGLNTAVGASSNGPATSLSVTALTNVSERVEDCTASSKSGTFTHGDDQTGDTDLDHSTQSLRLVTSTQNGSDGGVMSNATGSTVLQAKVAVSLVAGTPDPPSTATLTQSKYQFIYPYGTEAGASAVKAANTTINIQPTGTIRIRMEVTGGADTTAPFGAALYCRKNADSYTRAINTYNGTVFRLYGGGVNGDLPSSGTATTQRLSVGNFVAGAIIRNSDSTFTVPALAVGEHTELDFVLQLNASVGDTINCRVQADSGAQLDTYTVTPTMTIVPTVAGYGY